MDVLGQSGKMTLTNGPNSVTVEMDSIYELDSAGSIIANTGPNSEKHSRQTFASVPFDINSTPRRTDRYGVPASAIDFSTTLVGGSSLNITSLVFSHHGTIAPTQNESWTVAGGTVKFNLEISNWPFCSGEGGNPCSGATGEYLEIGMVIKGATDSALSADGSGKRFTLSTDAAYGNNVTLELSDEVWVGDRWIKMPTGFPSVSFQGSKQVFKFRLPRFAGTALYDPIVSGLGAPLPPSPPPPLSSNIVTQLELTATGSVEDFTSEVQRTLAQAISQLVNVPESYITITVTPASVSITIAIASSNQAAAQTVASTLATSLSTVDEATSLLRSALPSITAISAPVIFVEGDLYVAANSNSGSQSGVVIAIAACAAVLLLVFGAVYQRNNKNSGSAMPAMHDVRLKGHSEHV